MRSKVFTIAGKELSRFFGDKRMLLLTLMPGLLIYVLYTFMGDALMSNFKPHDGEKYDIVAVNMPESIETMLNSTGSDFDITDITDDDVSREKQRITDLKQTLCIIFPKNFEEAIATHGDIPSVSVFYNSANNISSSAYKIVYDVLSKYESSLSRVFDLNAGDEKYDLADEKDITGMVFSSMMPMLLMIFLFSGCMSVASESIAGEKERGTIATLLITPLKRSELAIGKILALAVMALMSGASSTIGTMLSLPKLTGMSSDELNAAVYDISDYFALTGIIISTVLLIIAMISVISALAKTVKEAQMWVTPLMVVVMLIGVTGMLGSGAKSEWYFYLIPLYNSVQSMVSLFTFNMSAVNVIISISVNIFYAVVGTYVLTKMFDNERILFSR